MENLNSIPSSGIWSGIASAISQNFNKLKVAILGLESKYVTNKGYYPSLSSLQAAFPNPATGLSAYVHDGITYKVANAANGSWIVSEVDAPAIGVDLTEYAKKTDLQDIDLTDYAKTTDLNNKIDKTAVKQESGTSETDVMSQKAVTEALSNINISELSVFDVKNEKDVTGEIKNGYIKNDGTFVTHSSYIRTDKIELPHGVEVWVQSKTDIPTIVLNAWYDSNGNLINTFNHTNGALTKPARPNSAKYIAISSNFNEELKIIIKDIGMNEKLPYYEDISGFDIPSGYQFILKANSKIYRVIDGKTLVSGEHPLLFLDTKVSEIGKYLANIFDLEFEKDITGVPVMGSFADKDGNFVQHAGFKRTDKVSFNPEKELWIHSKNNSPTVAYNVWYDKNGVFIDKFSNTGSLKRIIPPADAKYVVASSNNNEPLQIIQKEVTYSKIKEFSSYAFAQSKSIDFFNYGANLQANKTIDLNTYGIITLGQSNMVGYSPNADLTPNGLATSLPIKNWIETSLNNSVTPNTWGVWWVLLNKFYEDLPDKTIYWYHYAAATTSMHSNWQPITGDRGIYVGDKLSNFKNAYPNVNIRTVVMIQGENDMNFPYNEAYYSNLRNFIQYCRGLLRNIKLNFVIVGMHKNQGYYDQIVRNAMVRIAEEDMFTHFVNPDSLTFSSIDGVHYDTAYNMLIGNLIYDTIKDL